MSSDRYRLISAMRGCMKRRSYLWPGPVRERDRTPRAPRLPCPSDDSVEVAGEEPDGREAVEIAALLRPDVVLTDVRMPNLDGIAATRELLERVRRHGWRGPRATRRAQVVVDDQHAHLRSTGSGATSYLRRATRPSNSSTLVADVRVESQFTLLLVIPTASASNA